ncbi:helix-turn-helix domain-containing protein [Kribbella sp. CA-294648]|uniref:helix-turn-helix domain-containing protein n=1 Tax=Kribbella sp. CA-294648 TaxID=3239948 RepID=UPI003D919222
MAESDSPRTTYTAPVRRAVLRIEDRLDEQTVLKMVELYQAGSSSRRVGELFGVSKKSVLDALRSAGVVLRLPRMSEADASEAERLYSTGLSLAEVGKRLGRDHSTIYKALQRRGVKMRDTHGRP